MERGAKGTGRGEVESYDKKKVMEKETEKLEKKVLMDSHSASVNQTSGFSRVYKTARVASVYHPH